MTQLDSAAIESIVNLTRATETIVTVPGEQKGVYFLRHPDGSYSKERATLDPQDIKALSIDSLVKLVNHGYQAFKEIHVSEKAAVGVLADETHRQRITLDLPKHPAFQTLQGWMKLTNYSQKALTRLFRTELRDYIDPAIVRTFESITLRQDAVGNSITANANHSMDQSLIRKVQQQNGGEIPTEIVLEIPVFDLPETRTIRYPVRVLVETEPQDGKFSFLLIAVHTDLRDAAEKALQYVIKQISTGINAGTQIYESSL